MSELSLSVRDAGRIDAAAMERLGIPGLLLMEHAALGVARVARTEIAGFIRPRCTVLAGPGGNGGDGWAVARLLHHGGVDVRVHHLGEPAAGTDAAINMRIARSLGVPDDPIEPDRVPVDAETLIVDAMFGVGLGRPLAGAAEAVARRVAAGDARVLAIDVPSGLDADAGTPLGPAIRADVTATMVAPKHGMLLPTARAWVGRIEIVDIGIPRDFVLRTVRLAESRPVGDTVQED